MTVPADKVAAFDTLLEEGELEAALELAFEFLETVGKTPETLILVARVAGRIGSVSKAAGYLREAIALDPEGTEAKVNLAYLFHVNGNLSEAEPLFDELYALVPHIHELADALADTKFRLMRYEEAAKLNTEFIQRDPTNCKAIVFLAMSLWDTPERQHEIAPLLRSLEPLEVEHDILAQAAIYAFRRLKFDTARILFDKYFADIPVEHAVGGMRNAYAEYLRAVGQEEDCQRVADDVVKACDEMIELNGVSTNLIGTKLVAVSITNDEDRLRREYKRERARGPDPFEFVESGLTELAADSISRLQRLQSGKDAIIVAHGASAAGIVPHIDALCATDARFYTLNRFLQTREHLFSGKGRDFEGLLISNPRAVSLFAEELLNYFTADRENVFFTTKYALLGFQRLGISTPEILLNYHESIVLFNSNHRFAPSPFDPLQMMGGNSLSSLIPLVLLGRPKRIFIFGADGGNKNVGKAPTYFFGTPGETQTEKLHDIASNNRLLADSFEFDGLINLLLIGIEELFDIERPEIFNCSPDSALNSLPKISVDDAIQALCKT